MKWFIMTLLTWSLSGAEEGSSLTRAGVGTAQTVYGAVTSASSQQLLTEALVGFGGQLAAAQQEPSSGVGDENQLTADDIAVMLVQKKRQWCRKCCCCATLCCCFFTGLGILIGYIFRANIRHE